MPQMSPYNWQILFIIFNMIMLIFLAIIYFSMTPMLPPISNSTMLNLPPKVKFEFSPLNLMNKCNYCNFYTFKLKW